MKRIGLTQRVEVVASYGERRDCLDQNWSRFLLTAGFTPVPLSNAVEDVAGYLEALGLDGVVLTGGNDIATLEGASNAAPERDAFETKVLARCDEKRLPVVGVCRGMQIMNLSLGGRLEVVDQHVATRHRVSVEGESMEVNSYHRYAVPADGLGRGLETLGVSADGTVEAVRRSDGPACALMWHPEREWPFREWDLEWFREGLTRSAT